MQDHTSIKPDTEAELQLKLYIYSSIAALILLPISYIPAILDKEYLYLFFDLLAYAIFFVNMLIIRKVRNPKWCYRTSFFTGILASTLFCIFGSERGDIQSASALWLFFFPPLLFYFLGTKEAIVWVLITVMTFVTAVFTTELFKGYPHPNTFSLLLVLVFIVMSIISHYFETERSKHNQAIIIQNENNSKLIAMIAHDLRAPVGAVALNMDFLLKCGVQEDRDILLKHVKEQLNHVHETFDNIMTWVQGSTVSLVAQPVDINPASVVNSEIDFFSVLTTEKKIVLENNIKAEYIQFDKGMFSTIMRNLLSNAIKFSTPGSHVKIYSQESNGKISIFVKDSGVGIAPDKLETLFCKLSDSSAGTNNEKGFGLGLHLCDLFSQANGAQLTCTSTLGKETTFELSLS